MLYKYLIRIKLNSIYSFNNIFTDMFVYLLILIDYILKSIIYPIKTNIYHIKIENRILKIKITVKVKNIIILHLKTPIYNYI